MNKQLEGAFGYIDSNKDQILALWEELVNIESGTPDKEGVDAVAERIKGVLSDEGFEVRIVEYEKAGNSLVAEIGADRPGKGVVFAGHMDTVFKKGTLKDNPFRIEDGRAYGPGVLDMKGGIVAAIYAAKALNSVGYNQRPIKFILSGDEEIGHIYSTGDKLFIEEASGYAAAFDFETGYTDNGIVVKRKGVARFFMEIQGVSAHTGNAPEKGRSAILEMAYKTIDIHKLSNWDEGTLYNVGVIHGGTVANAVPDYVKAEIDVRFDTVDKGPEIIKQLEQIAAKTYVEGTSTKLTGGITFSPMETTEGVMKLFKHVEDTSVELGFDRPYPKTSGGGSDAANLVLAGVPTVCAVGVKGEWNHTPRENAVVETIFERAKLIAACVLRLNEDLI
jgi:glutamate carboxypeptidase